MPRRSPGRHWPKWPVRSRCREPCPMPTGRRKSCAIRVRWFGRASASEKPLPHVWATANPDKRRALALLRVSDTVETRAASHKEMAFIAALRERARTKGPMKDAPMTFVAAMMNSMAETTIDFMPQDPKNADAHSKVGFDASSGGWRISASKGQIAPGPYDPFCPPRLPARRRSVTRAGHERRARGGLRQHQRFHCPLPRGARQRPPGRYHGELHRTVSPLVLTISRAATCGYDPASPGYQRTPRCLACRNVIASLCFTLVQVYGQRRHPDPGRHEKGQGAGVAADGEADGGQGHEHRGDGGAVEHGTAAAALGCDPTPI